MTDSGVPKSFTASVDRPFEPIGIRDLTLKQFDQKDQRLTDEQVQQLISNPPAQKDPNARVKALTAEANKNALAEYEQEKVYNLSLRDLATRTTTTIHDILDDLVNYDPADGIRGFIQIFITSDRLMYIGIIVLVFTLLTLLFKSTDRVPIGSY